MSIIYTSIHAHTYLNYSSCWEVYSIDYITGGIDGLCIQLVESYYPISCGWSCPSGTHLRIVAQSHVYATRLGGAYGEY